MTNQTNQTTEKEVRYEVEQTSNIGVNTHSVYDNKTETWFHDNDATSAWPEAHALELAATLNALTATNQTETNQAGERTRIEIGSRVRCNHLFAAAFEGQEGSITDTRIDTFGKRLWTITFDTPTPAATNWPPCKTLAAEADCYERL